MMSVGYRFWACSRAVLTPVRHGAWRALRVTLGSASSMNCHVGGAEAGRRGGIRESEWEGVSASMPHPEPPHLLQTHTLNHHNVSRLTQQETESVKSCVTLRKALNECGTGRESH